MHGLYAILDPDHCAGRDPLWVAREILKAGAKTLQLRVKNRPFQEVFALACALQGLKAEFEFCFMVNDSLEIALAVGADGLHLGQGDGSPLAAREALGPTRLLGLSTHSLEEVRAANALPLDYIGFGAIFQTATKGPTHPVQGLSGLAAAVSESRHPLVAIGGVSPERVPAVLETGAAAYAVISAIGEAADVGAVVRLLCRIA